MSANRSGSAEGSWTYRSMTIKGRSYGYGSAPKTNCRASPAKFLLAILFDCPANQNLPTRNSPDFFRLAGRQTPSLVYFNCPAMIPHEKQLGGYGVAGFQTVSSRFSVACA